MASKPLRDVQNPYDPSGWTGRIELVESDDIGLVVNDPTLIADADPYRIWLLFVYDPAAASVTLFPRATLAVQGIGHVVGSPAILIHNASYPGLVQSQWYATARAGPTIGRVISGRAIF